MNTEQCPHIVVLGAGFGGLTFCQTFRHAEARITVIDRQNHHLFQPLLYQVATAGLSAPEIAQPIRSILSDQPNVRVLMDEVREIRLGERAVVLRDRPEPVGYDYLIIALGGVTTYFGHPEWEALAPGLKSLEDAVRIRRRVLLAFERAEMEPDPAVQRRLMTIVVVGGGPTGVELAGAFSELSRNVLRTDFRRIDPTRARVVLIEASPVVLSNFPKDLGENATQTLREMGVEVHTSAKVKALSEGRVELDTGEVIEAETVLWAAGVGANPLTRTLGVAVDRAGRIQAAPDCSLPGHPEAFAIGDLVSLVQEDGRPVPGVSPAAMQMARHVARLIEQDLASPGGVPAAERPPFRYWDKGSMATIGRSAAVAYLRDFHLTGMTAWFAWLLVHLLFLIGFRNKLAVFLQWTYSYFTYKRGARIISGVRPGPP
ncbi:MAG TPA: FAD-dependent oxidoreductase [Verrucomicrobiales bacterium]|nr:FAD-dependent oxidoreductase [Verrucomicrobiales bacterium]